MRGHCVPQRNPSAERHTYERNATEIQAIKCGGQPRDVICCISDRVIRHALARLAHDVDGIHAVVSADVGDIRCPHHRRGHVPVQQHQRRRILRARRDDVRHPEPRRDVELFVRDRPQPQPGIIGGEELGFTSSVWLSRGKYPPGTPARTHSDGPCQEKPTGRRLP